MTNDPKDKRVSKSDEWLQKNIINLFASEKNEWKIDEVEKKLAHPRAGVVKVMSKLCT